MRKRLIVALAAVAVGVMVLAPAASHASPLGPNMPGVTYPANAGGYQTGNLTVTGFADPLVTIRINLGDPSVCPPSGCGNGPLLGSTSADAFGNWQIPISVGEGQHRIYVFANNGIRDSVPLVRDFLVDSTPPAAPTIDEPADSSVFNTRVVDLSGTAEPRAYVVVVDENGGIRTTTAARDGSWDLVAVFTNGAHTIEAYQDDLAYNVSPLSSPVSFTVDVDVTPPDAPVITAPVAGSINPAAVTITGTAEPLSTVSVFEHSVDGFIVYGTAATDANGDWSLPVTLLDSTHYIQATATDPSGNVSAASPVDQFQVDALAPKAHIDRASMYLLGQLMIEGDSAVGEATDNVDVASVEVTYTDITGAVAADDTAVCSCGGPSVHWSDTPAGLLPGIYTVTVSAVDEVGNRSQVDQINVLFI